MRFHSVNFAPPQTSTIFAYNLRLCKMLSVAPFFEKNSAAAAFSQQLFQRFFQLRKIPFLPTLPTRSKEKMRRAFEVLQLKILFSIERKMWKTSNAFAEPVSHIYNNSDNNRTLFFLFKSRIIQQKRKNFSGWERLFAERKHKIDYRRKNECFLRL